MKLSELLENYDTELLDRISADKVDEAIGLRLPTSVIIQEIISALSSQSYISGKIQYAKPPVFAILNLILQSPGRMVAIEGFRDRVLNYMTEISSQASLLTREPHTGRQLYIKILKRAWESDGFIDKNEAHILELIRQELGIWDQEHFVLMHDESVLKIWDAEQEYYSARNYLLTLGIVLTHEEYYVLADEVAEQVKKSFGIEITNHSFRRLLDGFFREDLAQMLGQFGLNISGTKEAMIERLTSSLVPPFELISVCSLEVLRDFCKHFNIVTTGSKNSVIQRIIDYFDKNLDIKAIEEEEPSVEPAEPEPRELNDELFQKILSNLTGQQLYDILYQCRLATSGSKEEKIKRIAESVFSERTVLHHLRKEDLAQLCKRFMLPIYGSKQEVIDRILNLSTQEHPAPIDIEEILAPTVAPDSSQPVAEPVIVETSFDHVPLPHAYEEISMQFPDFEHGEKLVLSLIKEAKSITEQELERIVAKYKLGWFLYRAHMIELIGKLQRLKQPLIRIKSVPNANIYQWAGSEAFDANLTERKAARDIIDALRHGVVPKNNLETLMVGQQSARNHLSETLFEITSNKSHFKFIRGQYGSGKTFLCSWLKEFALSNEFAVSFINVGHDQPLSDLPVFFSGLINGIRTPEKTDSSALIDILESWLHNIHTREARLEGIDLTVPENQLKLKEIVERSIESHLANLNDMEPGFSQAVRSFYKGKIEGDQELVSNSIAWITGSRSLSGQALRNIGVKGYLEAHLVFQRMRAILEIINGARYKGLLLLIDELELVRKFPQSRQREQAFETLRLLVDEVGRNALPGCFIIFTGTDEFFEDERCGLKSYEALADRIRTPLTHEAYVSMRQPIISLESLDSDRLSNVLFKIRDLYGVAYNWDSESMADDQTIRKLVSEWTVFGDENVERKPRPVLREFIQMLDLCEENHGVHLSHFLKGEKTQHIDVINLN